MNLFWQTRKLTGAKEDHLTEFIAAALEVSPGFRQAYYDLVLAEYAKRNGWGAANINSVSTQMDFDHTDCRPDMILRLSNGKTIACEHKLDATETPGENQDASDEKEEILQLERYLKLPVDGLVYVRSSWKPPRQDVLAHAKYISPVSREHFLWRDFYPLLTSDDHVLLRWLRDGFEQLGFTPPHPSIGEMSGRDKAENDKNRKNFTKFWDHTRSCAKDMGWKVGSGSIVELYLSGTPSSLASDIFISPTKSGSDRFLFRVTPQKAHMRQTSDLLKSAVAKMSGRINLAEYAIKRKEGKVSVIDNHQHLVRYSRRWQTQAR